eukprot:TRINITY_DN4312_c0_g1_i5.p1 TRINITY_DN4312_c0_g1~~TRINITY_DN4312_c0_g1_i5.p1  ORF type:complete len:127 (-),score=43.08 TRINITY_DN4312_c0_g1_i5:90-470(-)
MKARSQSRDHNAKRSKKEGSNERFKEPRKETMSAARPAELRESDGLEFQTENVVEIGDQNHTEENKEEVRKSQETPIVNEEPVQIISEKDPQEKQNEENDAKPAEELQEPAKSIEYKEEFEDKNEV